ncbi:MAG: bile acid:sodium symporter [Myxococcales bacterium]|nr:bile acid:sodium symporter [Myxococcales bacterium]
MLTQLQTILLAALLVVLMAGMGASLTLEDFREVLRRPRGPLIGLLSQYGWMPLIAFGLCKALGLPDDLAISLIVVGCTPGGTTSNLFTYFAGADVALSVSMTALSTIAAVVLMPLTLYIYASGYASAGLKIPYGNITTTLAVMLVPLAIGMVVRARRPGAARVVESIGGVAGLGVLGLLIGTGLYNNMDVLRATTGTMYAAALGLGVLGFGFGWFGARVAGLSSAQRRAVAFETGIQNSPLALGILIASFPGEQQARMLWLPLLYALLVLISASVLTLGFRLARRAA